MVTKTNLLVLGIIFVLVVVAFALVNNNPKSTESIKIGYIGAFTGDMAAMGLGEQKAAMLAVDEINKAGGINGRPIEMIYEDSKCNAGVAASAANKLINVDGVKYILGGLCSSETLAIAPIAESSKVVVISPVSSNPAISNAGDYTFRVYPSDAFQGKVAAEFAFNNLSARKVAVLSCISDYCSGLAEVFKRNFVALGGQVVSTQEFEQTSRDLKTQLAVIKDSNPDLIYSLAYTDSSIAFLQQAEELGINVTFFGGDTWGEYTIWNNTRGIADGSMYLVPKTVSNKDFENRLNAKFGGPQELVLAALNTYDIVYIYKTIISAVGDDSEAVKNALYALDYKGLSGHVTFDSNGDLKTAEYDVMIVRNSSPEVLRP